MRCKIVKNEENGKLVIIYPSKTYLSRFKHSNCSRKTPIVLLMFIVLFMSFCILPGRLALAVDNYQLIDLGTNGYDNSYARSINNDGVIAGELESIADSTINLFKWQDGIFEELPYEHPMPVDQGYAASINDHNEIAGTMMTRHAMSALWGDDGTVSPISEMSFAEDVNNLSQVVVSSFYFDMTGLWEGGKLITIIDGMLSDIHYSYPDAINDSSEVVGTAWIDEGVEYREFAFLWKDGELLDLNDVCKKAKTNTLPKVALPLDPAITKIKPYTILRKAVDINNLGQVVGYADVFSYGPAHGVFVKKETSFLWDGRSVTDIGFKYAEAINDNVQIVGSQYLFEDGVFFDLHKLIDSEIYFEDLDVEDINNSGQIVGSAFIDGSTHAILLNPMPSKFRKDLPILRPLK